MRNLLDPWCVFFLMCVSHNYWNSLWAPLAILKTVMTKVVTVTLITAWFLFRKTPKRMTNSSNFCWQQPGWNFLYCEDDVIKMRQNLEPERLTPKDPDVTLSRGRTTHTHARTHGGLTDCCWVTGAQQTHTDTHTERECERSPSMNAQSEQVILIELLKVVTLL